MKDRIENCGIKKGKRTDGEAKRKWKPTTPHTITPALSFFLT